VSGTDIYIDCYGKHHGSRCVELASGDSVHFLYEPEEKCGISGYTMALFLNQAALSDDIYRYSKERRICFLSESSIHPVYAHVEHLRNRFRFVFTHNKKLLDLGEPFVKHYIGTSWIENISENKIPEKKKLVSLIGSLEHGNSHGYGLRKQVADLCLAGNQVDCYGKGIRPVESKLEALADYAFSIAMENVREDYYFSEKLVDCILAGSVPIYWGCTGIGEVFDSRGMIQFDTTDELESILERLNMDTYKRMLPYARENRRRVIEQNWHSLDSCYFRLADILKTTGNLGELPTLGRAGNGLAIIRKICAVAGNSLFGAPHT